MASKKQTVVILQAKTEKGKEKIAYHGEKWYLKEEITTMRLVRSAGPSLVVRSRDGSKILFIKKQDDPDIEYRIV